MWSEEFRRGMREFNRRRATRQRPLPDRKELGNVLGCTDVEDPETCGRGFRGVDNLAIALATYFSKHEDRPENDEADDETGWGKWVIEKTNEALRRAADAALARLHQ